MSRSIHTPACFQGIAAAPAYLYQQYDFQPSFYRIMPKQVKEERMKFQRAREASEAELMALSEKNEIFAAHLELLRDKSLNEKICQKIETEGKNAQMALSEVIKSYTDLFQTMENDYFRERGADIKDIGKRLLCQLEGIKCPDLGSLSEEVIVVAKELLPSDTVRLNPAFVKGILTEKGGVTSHAAIMARSMNIPVLVGVKGILEEVTDGMWLCMDAEKGVIELEPEEAVKEEYRRRKEAFEQERLQMQKQRDGETQTRSGEKIHLSINAGNLSDIRQALPMNIDGVGLFRSEFLYMENSHFPTEEEQFAVYKEAVGAVKELTIRTLDIGGDKELPYYSFSREENPFLGFRGIRISLDMRDMFRAQLRAILRAGAFGKVRMIVPMVISVEEIRAVRKLIRECQEQLKQEGLLFDENMELGVLLETPASVFLAEEFAKEADFFSIGTNDLTQYLLAVDRGNHKVAERFDYFHPAVLKAVAHIIKVGQKNGIRVSMCGEMAGDVKAVPLLLKMGLKEFSMASASIDYVRKIIREY